MNWLKDYLYLALKIFARFYFIIINGVFEIINLFRNRESVPPIPARREGELLLLSATKAAKLIRDGELTSNELVQAYINRIKEVNPLINAVVNDMFEEALEAASKVDQFLADTDKESDSFKQLASKQPLLGIPCTIKDNIKVKGYVTLAGNKKFLENLPNEEDAGVVKKLRDAGAIILATTNLPRLANGWEATNAVTGRTRNPYDLRRSPGGSSSGEGAIIASGASPFGIGNDLGGSVRLPAAMCGIFGLKPSPGLITLKGIIPEAMVAIPWVQELAVSGPMCRYAEDLSLIMEVLVEEESDKYALNLDRRYDFHTTKIYYMEELNHVLIEPMHPGPKAAVKKAAQYFEQAFAAPTTVVHFPLADHILEIFSALSVDENFKCPTYFQCIQEVIKFIFCDSDATTIELELSFLQATVLNDPRKIEKLRNDCNKLRNEVIDLLGDNGLLLCATTPMPPRFHGQLEFVQFNFAYTCLFTALRLPSLVCPIGLDEQNSMPVGIQLVGKPNSDGFLIEAAKELEKGACGGWIAPWEVSP